MSEIRRLRTLSSRQQRLKDEQERIRGKIVGEIVEIMTKHQIDLSIVRNAFRERFIKEQPQNRRYAKRPIRFRDPKTGDTWAGLGATPTWLRKRIEQGYSKEDFRVEPPMPVE